MPTVIVADDSMFQRFTLSKMLKDMGFDIMEAKNGQECLDIIAGQAPDVILLDLNMPARNGFEILEELQSRKMNIPTIVISADIQESSKKRCLDMGAKAVLGKPVSQENLAAILNELSLYNA